MAICPEFQHRQGTMPQRNICVSMMSSNAVHMQFWSGKGEQRQ